DAMPGNVALVTRGRVHRPAGQSRAVTVVHQAGDLPVSHHPPARNSQNDAIDLFKRLLELLGARTRAVGDAATGRGGEAASGFLRFFFSAHPLSHTPRGLAQAIERHAYRRVTVSPSLPCQA